LMFNFLVSSFVCDKNLSWCVGCNPRALKLNPVKKDTQTLAAFETNT